LNGSEALHGLEFVITTILNCSESLHLPVILNDIELLHHVLVLRIKLHVEEGGGAMHGDGGELLHNVVVFKLKLLLGGEELDGCGHELELLLLAGAASGSNGDGASDSKGGFHYFGLFKVKESALFDVYIGSVLLKME
jgi:hypothetical protein